MEKLQAYWTLATDYVKSNYKTPKFWGIVGGVGIGLVALGYGVKKLLSR